MAERFPNAASTLGEFLAGRRARVDPIATGIGLGAGRRRVSGLRREEVAVRAGVSVDYYTRLEQGRELHPSAQLLEALAEALLLDDDARLHLHRLGGTLPVLEGRAIPPTVSRELRRLLDELRDSPALVLDASLDVLARNHLCEILHDGFTIVGNSARMVFLDPAGRSFYEPWDRAAESSVASLRLAVGRRPADESLRRVIAELSSASEEFRELWARQDVRAKTNEIKHLRHPRAGMLTFAYQSFDVRDAPGQQLVVFGSVENDPSSARLLAAHG